MLLGRAFASPPGNEAAVMEEPIAMSAPTQQAQLIVGATELFRVEFTTLALCTLTVPVRTSFSSRLSFVVSGNQKIHLFVNLRRTSPLPALLALEPPDVLTC